MEDQKQLILVTGFGPFGEHKINASWEAVKLLPDEFEGHKIIKYEVPVSYTDVGKQIPELWDLIKPKLVIHVGVSSEARKITIETMAHRVGYDRLDCYGMKHPTGNVCLADSGEDCIPTTIRVKEICELLNGRNDILKYATSENAGRYLCEYIYYTSLRKDKTKAIFVHVPPIDKPYTAQQLSCGLLEILKCALKECS